MDVLKNSDTEVCLAYCNRTDLSSWPHHAKVIMKNSKIGIVVDENDQRRVIVPIEYDMWFDYDGYKTKIEADFFDDWRKCSGYFANKNEDGTYTCYEYDREGHFIRLFSCESFDEDTITVNGKKYIGRSDEQEGFDDVKRIGIEVNSGYDNSYFALRQKNRWSLMSDDLKFTYLDYVECDRISYLYWTPLGIYVVAEKDNKNQLFICRQNGTSLTLNNLYDSIMVIDEPFINNDDHFDNRGYFVILYDRIKKKQAICSIDLQHISPFIFDRWDKILNHNEIMVERSGHKMVYHIIDTYGWAIKSFRLFDNNEIDSVQSNEIVASKHGKSVRFCMFSGEFKFIPLSEYSLLNIGDSLDLRNAILITLCREGDYDIYQVIEDGLS